MAVLTTIAAALSAAGAAKGLYDSFKSDGDGRRRSDDGPSRGSRIMELFEQRVNRTEGQGPADSTFFQQGRGALARLLGEQEELDRAQLARLGAQGSELALAQRSNRLQAGASQLGQLLGQSDRIVRQDRQSALAGLLDASGLQERRAARRDRARNARRRQIGQSLGSALSAGASIFDTIYSNRQQGS